jgi:sulfatase maturation enzyme AslB (radical SAM superfamily)
MTQAENHQWNHVTYDFQTNGMLVSKMYQRYQWVFDRTEVLNISVDGSTAEVYEKLRKGGSFEKLLENFQFLQNVKRKFQVHLHMVVQKVNWHQMPAVFKMLDRYGFERAYFNLIQDWGTNININEQTEFVNQLKYNEIKAELSKDIRARLHQLS